MSSQGFPWGVLAVAALATGCTASGSMMTSAGRLEQAAMDVHQGAQRENASRDYLDDARALAQQARELRELLDASDRDDQKVQDAFADLSRRYHELRSEVNEQNDSDLELQFDDLTDAYLDVEREQRRYRMASK